MLRTLSSAFQQQSQNALGSIRNYRFNRLEWNFESLPYRTCAIHYEALFPKTGGEDSFNKYKIILFNSYDYKGEILRREKEFQLLEPCIEEWEKSFEKTRTIFEYFQKLSTEEAPNSFLRNVEQKISSELDLFKSVSKNGNFEIFHRIAVINMSKNRFDHLRSELVDSMQNSFKRK